MLRTKIILLILTVNSIVANCQPFFKVTNYQATYTKLTQPFALFSDKYWDVFTGQCAYLPLPFPFKFIGVDNNNVCVSKSGVLTFYHPQNFIANRILGFHTRYKERNLTAPFVSAISTQTETINSDRIFKVEYHNVGFYQSSNPTLYANFQIWLYEHTGIFEVHFGDINADTSAWLPSASSTKGPYCGVSLNEDRIYLLLGGNSDNPSWLVHNDTFLLDVPKPNLVYRYTPATTGLNDNNSLNRSFSIYPNPTINNITIAPVNLNTVYTFKVIDIYGKELLKGENLQGEEIVSLKDFTNSIVFIIIDDRLGGRIIQKVVVQ